MTENQWVHYSLGGTCLPSLMSITKGFKRYIFIMYRVLLPYNLKSIETLTGTRTTNLISIKQGSHEIEQTLYYNIQFVFWPCDLKINKEHLFRGSQYIKFDICQPKGSQYNTHTISCYVWFHLWPTISGSNLLFKKN